MSLRDHDSWKTRYNSPPDDLIRDFYIPALQHSRQYDRAVGFFSSALLTQVTPGLDTFVSHGGRMRLITSPSNLSDSDLKALGKGEALLRERINEGLTQEIELFIPDEIQRDRLALLTWMIAQGRLEIRIALRRLEDRYALMHEKIGVFTDFSGDFISWSGSPNETHSAVLCNSESFNLFRSWGGPESRAYAEGDKARLGDLWGGSVEGVVCWDASEWIRHPLCKRYGEREPRVDSVLEELDESPAFMGFSAARSLSGPRLPDNLKLRDYQDEAIENWLAAKGRGVLALATGMGKTITALAASVRLCESSIDRESSLLILVVVPSLDLIRQWEEAASWFGFRPAVCHGGLSSEDRRRLKRSFSIVRPGRGGDIEMVVLTSQSLTPGKRVSEGEHFVQRQLRSHKGRTLVIGDEMHTLGTQDRLAALPDRPEYTLGLSATPERKWDEEGTSSLLNYFGETVMEVGIRDAIYKYQCLVEYEYHPHRIQLTEEEAAEYARLSRLIAVAMAGDHEENADRLIRQRNNLKQHAENKTLKLRELMSSGLKSESQQIIYVAEGRAPNREDTQLEIVERMLEREFAMKVARYTGETSADRRGELQDALDSGDVQALLAMKCLDEGVDIPSVRIGIITASTQNPRQFVQRRGRLLRHDPHRPKTHAIIHDFLVVPPGSGFLESEAEMRMVGIELSRAAELAQAARNTEVYYEIVGWALDFGLQPADHEWMSPGNESESGE